MIPSYPSDHCPIAESVLPAKGHDGASSKENRDGQVRTVTLHVLEAVRGRAILFSWESGQIPTQAGDRIQLSNANDDSAEPVWQMLVKEGFIGQENTSSGEFMMPLGGPWQLSYLHSSEGVEQCLVSVPALDPGNMFIVSSLTSFSYNRNQFTNQLWFHLEGLYLARNVLNLGIVEPTFIQQTRNSTSYEEAIRSANGTGEGMDVNFSDILGILTVEYAELFDPAAMKQYSGRTVSRKVFEEKSQRVIDLLVVVDPWMIHGQACSRSQTCFNLDCVVDATQDDDGRGQRNMEFYGRTFDVIKVLCVPHGLAGDALIEKISDAVAALPSGSNIAVASGWVNIIFASERPIVTRESWADATESDLGHQSVASHQRLSTDFKLLARHLKPAQTIVRSMKRVFQEGIGSKSGGRYIAAHWRRGDRAHPEMGQYGREVHKLSSPRNFALNLNKIMKKTGIEVALVATNSGTRTDIDIVRNLTKGTVVLLRDLHVFDSWKEEFEALVTEMFLCVGANYFLASGIGEPDQTQHWFQFWSSSTISRFILRLRWLDATTTDYHYSFLANLAEPDLLQENLGLEGNFAAVPSCLEGTDQIGRRKRDATGQSAITKHCCSSGTSLRSMSCREKQIWLVCIGALEGPEEAQGIPCSLNIDSVSEQGLLKYFDTSAAIRVVECRNFETSGILYSVFASPNGDRTTHLLELLSSVLSLRMNPANSKLSVTVAIDLLPSHDPVVDKKLVAELIALGVTFVEVQYGGNSFGFKLQAMLSSPYDLTLFLDADTAACETPKFQPQLFLYICVWMG